MDELELLEEMAAQIDFEVQQAYDENEYEDNENTMMTEDFLLLGDSAVSMRLETAQTECTRLRRRERGLARESERLDLEYDARQADLAAAQAERAEAKKETLKARELRDGYTGERRALEKLLGQAVYEHSEDIELRRRELEVTAGDLKRIDQDLEKISNEISSLNEQILFMQNARSVMEEETALKTCQKHDVIDDSSTTDANTSTTGATTSNSGSGIRQLGSPFRLWSARFS
mmetsp:Transcript_4234/g.6454  ORF Transcript_4234/g.6454 Transcript_4234/m.6454 type:complete len:232 (-) Transcript_4234:475-1170(-)